MPLNSSLLSGALAGVPAAFRLFDLPTHHADPFDRQIIAQALVEDVPVVTPDETFNLYGGLKGVW